MDTSLLLDPRVTPLIIFIAKNIEISLTSVRIIVVSRGYRSISATLAFFESLVWLSSLSIIVSNLNNFYNILAFALGMSTGSFLGIYIEKKLALGIVLVRLITQKSAKDLLSKLRTVGFRVTSIDATSNRGKVQIVFAAIKRKSLKEFATLVRQSNPHAFFTVEDVREASQVVSGVSNKMVRNLIRSGDQNNPDNPDNFNGKKQPLTSLAKQLFSTRSSVSRPAVKQSLAKKMPAKQPLKNLSKQSSATLKQRKTTKKMK